MQLTVKLLSDRKVSQDEKKIPFLIFKDDKSHCDYRESLLTRHILRPLKNVFKTNGHIF